MSWGPFIGAVIALGGMFFALAIGYLIGYNDASRRNKEVNVSQRSGDLMKGVWKQ